MRQRPHSASPALRPEEPPASARRIAMIIARAWEVHTYFILIAAFLIFGWMYFAKSLWRDPAGKYALPCIEIVLLLILVYKLRVPFGRAARRFKKFYEQYKGEQKPF